MHIIHVSIQVKPEHSAAFIEATKENARNSIQEAGIVRFDFLQVRDDPTRFMLVEVYKTADDRLKHRETAHYLKWRDTVADMMSEPRSVVEFVNIVPEDGNWR